MVALELRGRITEAGTLDVQLPAGEVTVRIEMEYAEWERQPWTKEEIRTLMTQQPRTGAEIVAWLDANPPADPNWGGITDDGEVAEAVRQMRGQTHQAWGAAE